MTNKNMDVAMKLLAILIGVFSIAEIPIYGQTLVFTRPTIITIKLDQPPKYHFKVYEDEEYCFLYRHYGNDGKAIPGFFIQQKKLNIWVELKKLSTENAILGRSPSIEDFNRCPISVGWDFKGLKSNEFADLPLRTSGSIMFPDSIVRDAKRQVYILDNPAQCGLGYMLTRFYVRFDELSAAFK
jgi:hypothetical protein